MKSNFRERLVSFLECSFLLVLAFSIAACTGRVQYRNSDRADSDLITSYLSKPDGDGPFPAVVLLHGCAGLELDTRSQVTFKGLKRYQSVLKEAGFVSLIVDSWGSRGWSTDKAYAQSCGGRYKRERYIDLSGAIRYLKTLPYVKPKIGAVGLSQGGRTVIGASGWQESPIRSQLLTAAVAVYPSCILEPPRDFLIPLLILIGDADLITPAEHCQKWIDNYKQEISGSLDEDRLDEHGRPLGIIPEIVIYPGAYHDYDMLHVSAATPIGHSESNRAATRDTRERIIAFFRKHLR